MTETAPTQRYSDDDLLKMVGEERKRSIGFGEGESGELSSAREKATRYYKGEMTDVPSLPNRSSVVDTTVADAIETVLPDVLEIFVGGDDVATFIPNGEQDEDAAREESDFINHVVFVENEGFLTLYTAMKDGLLNRTGILHWWMEDEEKEETAAQVPAEMAEVAQAVAAQGGQQLEPAPQDDGSVALMSRKLHGRAKIRAFPCEDFTCGADTVSLRDATYCAVRDRPRVQELIARGIDPAKARALKSYTQSNDAQEQARDEAGEHNTPMDSATADLRTVEVRAHYIRLADEDGSKLKIWRVITDAEETVLLDKEECDHIPFAALTPYIIPHRFYGESVADKLIEVQKIKTVLWRAGLDNIYFALNQRMEVSDAASNEHTVADLLRNEPGVPVRSKTGDAVRPISAGPLNVDTFAALEYAATMAESRSGIVRNAQGLNPDTLHDTAKGAMALISAAQKRVRLIARIFAETGVKDLYLGLHCMLRNGYSAQHAPASAKLRNSWKTIQPNNWPERCAMAIHVGVGSAGKEHDLMVSTQRLELMERLANLPGAMGSLIDGANIHQGLTAWERAAGSKSPDVYWSDPKDAQPQEPKPDPEVVKAKAEIDLKRESTQAELELQAGKHQAQMETDAEKDRLAHEREMARLTAESEIKRYQVDQELQLKRETTQAELAMKRELLVAELQMKHETAILNAEVARETGMAKVEASSDVSEVNTGGDPG